MRAAIDRNVYFSSVLFYFSHGLLFNQCEPVKATELVGALLVPEAEEYDYCRCQSDKLNLTTVNIDTFLSDYPDSTSFASTTLFFNLTQRLIQ